MDHFTTNLQILRTAANQTQGKCAEDNGLERTTWSNYENGHSKPGFADLLKIAKYFDINLTRLVEEDLRKDAKLMKQRTKQQSAKAPVSNVMNEPVAEYQSLSKRINELEKAVMALQGKAGKKR
ncbi:MAG: helix-turn-helix transcriptional regulator [Ferruginibacter sp.]